MHDPNQDADARIARVEVLVEGLAKDLSSLATTVESYVTTNGRTNWALVLGGIAALGSFIWLYVGPVATSTNNNHEAVVSLQERAVQDAYTNGVLHTEVKWIKERLDKGE